MKIWTGYGSEHSYNLVLIGKFVDETAALKAHERLEKLREVAEHRLPDEPWEPNEERFSDEMYKLLKELDMYDLGPSDIENFVYEHDVTITGDTVQLNTDEIEIQGFLKLLLKFGAKVEIYSAHDWTDDGKPIQTNSDETSTQETQ